MSMLDAPVAGAYHLVTALTPVCGSAAAIVLFTMAVRLTLLPLAIRQARGDRIRARLLPKIEKLRARHRKDPQRLDRELRKLYAAEGATPYAGCLPAIAQWPFFMVMYRLFVSGTVAGHQNALLAHTLLGMPLGENWIGVLALSGPFGPPALVFYGLFAGLAAVAWWTVRRLPPGTPGAAGTLARVLPFGTVIVAGAVPLAAGLYLLTTTTWTAAERALLRRDLGLAA
jgi:YidC/Oxa1 family membrane protein insertase